jgi:outer membrane protein OmpA-like peptidoglycan-associated protein
MVTGCAGFELGKAERMTANGSTFDKGLYDGYMTLSKNEFSEGDYKDSDFFARSAMAASGGTASGPQEITARNLPAGRVDDLTGARTRLVAALDSQAAQDLPDQAANAQVMFDCWMQEQEENLQPKDIAACRGGFDAALNELDARNLALAEAEKAKLAKAAPAAAPVMAKEEMRFVVYFDTDKADIGEAASAVLAEAEAAAKKLGASSVLVLGNTDTVGKGDYNMTLSNRRADAVAKQLITQGIADTAIKLEARGMSDLAVSTGPQVNEPKNRRVEIIVKP